jgi:hypothetical protein
MICSSECFSKTLSEQSNTKWGICSPLYTGLLIAEF